VCSEKALEEKAAFVVKAKALAAFGHLEMIELKYSFMSILALQRTPKYSEVRLAQNYSRSHANDAIVFPILSKPNHMTAPHHHHLHLHLHNTTTTMEEYHHPLLVAHIPFRPDEVFEIAMMVTWGFLLFVRRRFMPLFGLGEAPEDEED
jgi:hypothetical protein